MCPTNYENSENVEMNPFCVFDANDIALSGILFKRKDSPDH